MSHDRTAAPWSLSLGFAYRLNGWGSDGGGSERTRSVCGLPRALLSSDMCVLDFVVKWVDYDLRHILSEFCCVFNGDIYFYDLREERA